MTDAYCDPWPSIEKLVAASVSFWNDAAAAAADPPCRSTIMPKASSSPMGIPILRAAFPICTIEVVVDRMNDSNPCAPNRTPIKPSASFFTVEKNSDACLPFAAISLATAFALSRVFMKDSAASFWPFVNPEGSRPSVTTRASTIVSVTPYSSAGKPAIRYVGQLG